MQIIVKRVFVQHVSKVTRSILHNKEPVKLVAPVVSSSLVKRRQWFDKRRALSVFINIF